MTIQDFVEKYYLHDSLITKISHNACSKTVTIEVEFCFWLQKNYKNSEPETGMIRINFLNVTHFDSNGILGEIDYFSILETKVENDNLIIIFLDDFHHECYTITLHTTEVTVEK